MTAETTVKKRSRVKKVVPEDAPAPATSPAAEPTVKKTRARKPISKVVEGSVPVDNLPEPSKITEARETGKKEKPAVNKAATSKRAAKKSSNELQVSSPVEVGSEIVRQATAFREEHREVNPSVGEPLSTQTEVEKLVEELKKPMKSQKPRSKLSTTIPSESINDIKASESVHPVVPNGVSAPGNTVKPSSFLNSFFNDPEPAPVPPPQSEQERITSPEESRAELKEVTRHDFEDAMLTSRGKVRAAAPVATASSHVPASVIELQQAAALSSAQMRAFTTSSFAALRAGSFKTKGTTSSTESKTTPNTSSTSAPATATSSAMKSKGVSKSSTSTIEAISKIGPKPFKTAPKSHPPLQPPAPPAPSSPLKPTSQPRLTPKPLPYIPQPTPRPTQLPYAELKKHPEYKRLKRKWITLIVAVPFAVLTSWELWRRWKRGDFGGRDWRKEGPNTGFGVEGEEERGLGERLFSGQGFKMVNEAVLGSRAGGAGGAEVQRRSGTGEPVFEVEASSDMIADRPRPIEGLREAKEAGSSDGGWMKVFK